MRCSFGVVVSLLALGVGCAADDVGEIDPLPDARAYVYDGPPVPWDVTPFPRVFDPADNPSNPEKVELGRLLFYDPVLSRDHLVACATCHSEEWGLADGLDRSVGVDGEGPTGPGRTGPNRTPRNALALWNVAFRSDLFWDGRASTLEEQAILPIAEPVELGNSATVIADIGAVEEYTSRFAAAFPEDEVPVSLPNVARALAAFQRTFVSSRAPYDQYVGGDAGAMSPSSLRGMTVFAELGCATCHEAPLFASDRYARRIDSADPGRFDQTGDPADRGAFRVPSLRNARETGPFFHDGSVGELEEAVRVEVAVEVAAGRVANPSAEDVAALVSFVEKALMDRSRDPERPARVPSGLPVPVDGFRIPR